MKLTDKDWEDIRKINEIAKGNTRAMKEGEDEEKTCACCGGSLPKGRSKYCSDECVKRAKDIYELGYSAGYNNGYGHGETGKKRVR